MLRFPPCRLFLLLSMGLFLGACEVEPGSGPGDLPPGVECVDHRVEWGSPSGAEYFIEVPTMVVPPGEEILFCYYGTYEGEDSGVVGFRPQEPEGFLHHTLLKRVSDDDYEDGHLMDCSAPEFQWPPKPVLFESVGAGADGWINLPEGIAFKLSTGQRWVADVHYINTSPDTICVNTAFYLDVVPESEVESYAAAFNLDAGGFELPPGEESTESFSCEWEQDLNILSLAGHMHEHGREFDILHHRQGGPPDSVYSVETWEADFQTGAPVTNFDFGELEVSSGDLFETVCTWFNGTDHSLSYPDEMCTTFGVAYPLDEPLFCDNGTFGTRTGGGGGPRPGGDGVVQGTVSRTHPFAHDGVGDLHFFIFTSVPGPGADPPVGMKTLVDVDLSADGATVDYQITDLPIGETTLYISAFFDDDGSGSMGGPTEGDLVVASSPEELAFVLPDASPVTVDLALNSLMN
jgi:hypothetical protein